MGGTLLFKGGGVRLGASKKKGGGGGRRTYLRCDKENLFGFVLP